ncbi:hypothetical protein NCCP2716_10340 [Sporosarcina sp. NCCP-2716]|uniref:YIP1 family protein n=1 Tax=Sporosarcina sp. NCCP-2716 TaxID=2943679 RepID=UPI002040D509|nr:YIP1 family protein [Sporosarcina sp. NCCP-2716]GKV68536.1 hypothetical protein NCCP2716_10340 [Sporosarcina sp. NCCP-2716]
MNGKPLITIWSRPMEVLEYMRKQVSLKYAVFILALAALATGGYQAGNANLFTNLPLGALIVVLIVLTFVGALISWVIGAALYTWIGKGMFGGHGTFSEMLRIVPASSIPMIWMAPVNYWIIAAFGKKAFMEPPAGSFEITYLPLAVFALVNFLTFALGIYSLVISCKGIGLIHGFSAWRGFGVVLVVIAAGFLIIAAIAVMLVLFFSFAF